ncbi:hypothetical protein Patl1_07485 [Pistacia atlantica]|uniref:Uncharacterized protein n=1 Tax=Pistacia atlantica TaxID=434234 RepID=A0ACC1AKZ0_9ROSI|nr:hypothetical protein Patl1_07485 [Pistacia atlantica]
MFSFLSKYCRILTKRSLVKNCYPTLIHSTGMCILHS